MYSLEGSLGKAVGVLPEIAESGHFIGAYPFSSAVHREMEMVCPAAIRNA
jgi:hypothetical protein